MTAPHVLHTIILNWRTPALTLAAAEAALEAMEGIAGGITIVDNDSGDGSEAQLAAEAAARGASSLMLEVRASNAAARRLYARHGFEELHVRRRYYPGGEDAVIMRKAL